VIPTFSKLCSFLSNVALNVLCPSCACAANSLNWQCECWWLLHQNGRKLDIQNVESVRKLVSALLLVVLFGLPAMACLIPGAEMTEAERDCCKHMAQQCGSMNMPSSHSCCQKEVSRLNSMLGTSLAQLVAPALTVAVVSELPQAHVISPAFSSFEFHPPPESPPGTASILRI
jgi:hypothetical protein